MAETTNIEWCDATFNPWIGCTRVSPACDDCYAARSTPARTLGIEWGAGQPRRRTADDTWAGPKRWAKTMPARLGRRPRVFCSSLADWLDNEVPIEWLADLLDLIRCTPELDWLLLSKRIGNWGKRLEEARVEARCSNRVDLHRWVAEWLGGAAPAHVWLGATVVNQAEADRDVPKLLAVPARVRFLSVEPMLGPISFEGLFADAHRVNDGQNALEALDWVICGGESGLKARPMHTEWAAQLRNQCEEAAVPFLFKQWGEWIPEAAMTHAQRMRDCGQIESFLVKLDGSTHWIDADDHTEFDASDVRMVKVGKKAAGRLLDGRTHDGFPEVAK